MAAADYTQLLHQLYNDPSSPAGFAGVDQLWLEARKSHPSIPRQVVQDFLEGSRTYTLHRSRRVHFKRSRTIPAGYMTDFQSDLVATKAKSLRTGSWLHISNGYKSKNTILDRVL